MTHHTPDDSPFVSEPRDGFAGIRWTDTLEVVAARFAGRVSPTMAYGGRDPRTGQLVIGGPGLAIEDHPRDLAPAEIRLSTALDSDAHGITTLALTAAPRANTETWQEAEWIHYNELAAEVLRSLGRRLQLGDVSVELQEQQWAIDGVRITIAIDTGPGDFMLMMTRPDAERSP